jgi:hypothetical protein
MQHGIDLFTRHGKFLHHFFYGQASLQILEYRCDWHPGIPEHPGAANFAGDAFHGGTLRPIESCHVLTLPSIVAFYHASRAGGSEKIHLQHPAALMAFVTARPRCLARRSGGPVVPLGRVLLQGVRNRCQSRRSPALAELGRGGVMASPRAKTGVPASGSYSNGEGRSATAPQFCRVADRLGFPKCQAAECSLPASARQVGGDQLLSRAAQCGKFRAINPERTSPCAPGLRPE